MSCLPCGSVGQPDPDPGYGWGRPVQLRGLAAAQYCVVISPSEFTAGGTLANWSATTPNVGSNDAIDSDGDTTTHAATATVVAGQLNDTIDFGFTIESAYTVTKKLTGPNRAAHRRSGYFRGHDQEHRQDVDQLPAARGHYNSTYLTYGFGGYFAAPDTEVDHVNDGVLNWTDLTPDAPQRSDLAPGGTVVVSITFTARV